MGIYSTVESGTRQFKSRFHKSISFSKRYDCRFGEAIPVLAKFVLPGDVWRIGGNALVRFQPMRTPTLTPNYMKVRYFFVPLRLVEPNSELIITGSKDGHLYNGTLPEFDNFVKNADKTVNVNAFKVNKYTFWDYMGVQTLDYEPIKNNRCLPSKYWAKGYYRLYWDYYSDENISNLHQTYSEFENFLSAIESNGSDLYPFFVEMKKDYFTSSLPWQLKGTAPVLNVTGTWTPNFDMTNFFTPGSTSNSTITLGAYPTSDPDGQHITMHNNSDGSAANSSYATALNEYFENMLNKSQNVPMGIGFTADDLRTMMAQTRILERAARCGSRYTEYLKSNFGVAPADETLQRSQYLGGWSLPIVTTEVLQTAADGTTPVGTMRGHGITNGGNKIQTFYAKEFGLLFGIAHILPQTEYTTGIPKEYTYKSRFDFFNPSLQHLSEQEVRNGELYISNSDGLNDDTFGFQAYGNELRSSVNQTVGDLRDSQSDWLQALHFNSRPNLNNALITSQSHLASFNAPFAVQSSDNRPIIVDFYNDLDVYRPMVRYSTPGLVDHL